MKIRSNLFVHTRAELIIPWLVNGTLPPDTDPALTRHVATCPQCREDYEEQLRVRAAMRAEGPLVFAAESSFQKFLSRIQNPVEDREPSEQPPRADFPQPVRPIRQSSSAVRWLAAAVVLQAFALGAGAWAWHSSHPTNEAPYTTLTSAQPSYDSGPRARVLFRSELSVGALQTVLQGVGAHIIDGPEDGDVYTLGFSPAPGTAAALAQRVAALRANPSVLFAEPVQDGVR